MPPTARSRYRGHPRQPPPLKVLIWWWNASKSTGDADFLGCGDDQGVPRVVVLDDQSVEDVLIEVEVLVAESFYTRLVVSVRATNVKPGLDLYGPVKVHGIEDRGVMAEFRDARSTIPGSFTLMMTNNWSGCMETPIPCSLMN